MKKISHPQYRFGYFRVDVATHSVYYRDQHVDTISKKSVEILSVLLERPRSVVSHDEIIAGVWGDNYTGISANNVAQYIRKLRKSLSEVEPDTTFIGTAPNRGYIFEQDVEVVANAPAREPAEKAEDAAAGGELNQHEEPNDTFGKPADREELADAAKPSRRWALLIPLFGAIVIAAALGGARIFGENDHEAIKQVVKESQMFESMVIYRDPAGFDEALLDRYWTSDAGHGTVSDRRKIRDAINKLAAEGRRYGDETKNEQFDFQSVEVNAAGDTAVVKTLEKWFIAEYSSSGQLLKNKNVGPYFVSYVLHKTNGQWRILRSSTARANFPTPRLDAITPATPIEGGKQFFVNLDGDEFVSEVVSVRITGEGCAEANPCTVPNSALLKHSRLGNKRIENVPLTLARGEFLVSVQNGDSQPSQPVKLVVP